MTDFSNSWIFSDDAAMLRAAWTAMDQTYGSDSSGPLRWIDDASNLWNTNGPQYQPAPWVVPDGWTISGEVDAAFQGKFLIYTNSQTRQVMISCMGTNGNSDTLGWWANFVNIGKDQWDDKGAAEVFSK